MSDQPSDPGTSQPQLPPQPKRQAPTSDPTTNQSVSDPAQRVRDQLQAGPPVDEDVETQLWQGGYSPKAMLGSWVGLGVVTLVTLVVMAIYAVSYLGWALLALVVLWAIVGLVYATRRLGMHYELTTQRFIHQSGVLSRRSDRIEVIDIDDVSFQQGPVQRALGVGTITIESSDRSHPILQMKGIAGVREVAGLIDDIRRKERRRRSLHIEAI